MRSWHRLPSMLECDLNFHPCLNVTWDPISWYDLDLGPDNGWQLLSLPLRVSCKDLLASGSLLAPNELKPMRGVG